MAADKAIEILKKAKLNFIGLAIDLDKIFEGGKMIDHALAELEKGEEKAIDWNDSKNWIPWRTVVFYEGDSDKPRLYLEGDYYISLKTGEKIYVGSCFRNYRFAFNFPDPAELK